MMAYHAPFALIYSLHLLYYAQMGTVFAQIELRKTNEIGEVSELFVDLKSRSPREISLLRI